MVGLREWFTQTDENHDVSKIPLMVNMTAQTISIKKDRKTQENSVHPNSTPYQMQAASRHLDEDSDEDEDYQIPEPEQEVKRLQSHMDISAVDMIQLIKGSNLENPSPNQGMQYRVVPPITEGLQFRHLPPGTGGTYRSARLLVRGLPAIGQFRQKSTVGDRLKGEIDRRRSIVGETDRRWSTEREKGKKKKRKKKKNGKEKKKEYLSPARGPRPYAVAARARSPLASRQRPRAVATRGSRALFLSCGEKDRGDVPASTHYSMVFYFVSKPLVPGSLLQLFVDGDDEFRNSRFKLIPAVPKIDVDIGSSTVANGVLGLVFGVITTLVVDMAFLVQKS
ncbi:hypothetical protein GW17_00001716 [Ensete ventricosum]|nr:hypothetical protein GW17_00001716 [Ensete ventricosum]